MKPKQVKPKQVYVKPVRLNNNFHCTGPTELNNVPCGTSQYSGKYGIDGRRDATGGNAAPVSGGGGGKNLGNPNATGGAGAVPKLKTYGGGYEC